jgi:hypothetical protein
MFVTQGERRSLSTSGMETNANIQNQNALLSFYALQLLMSVAFM